MKTSKINYLILILLNLAFLENSVAIQPLPDKRATLDYIKKIIEKSDEIFFREKIEINFKEDPCIMNINQSQSARKQPIINKYQVDLSKILPKTAGGCQIWLNSIEDEKVINVNTIDNKGNSSKNNVSHIEFNIPGCSKAERVQRAFNHLIKLCGRKMSWKNSVKERKGIVPNPSEPLNRSPLKRYK